MSITCIHVHDSVIPGQVFGVKFPNASAFPADVAFDHSLEREMRSGPMITRQELYTAGRTSASILPFSVSVIVQRPTVLQALHIGRLYFPSDMSFLNFR